ncbi:MAG: hypothetical protein MJE68_01085, partial [Proteobacteria bacterium]|nr:hypothetical protein [Pseudomonadota bacterium]
MPTNINLFPDQVEHNTSQTKTLKDSEPPVQIPAQLWLHPITQEQIHEVSEIDTSGMKGSNKTNEIADDTKRSNMDIVSLTSDPIDKIYELLIISAKQHKCYIPLEKLKPDVIKEFCPRERSPSVDPYSSLEETADASDDVSAPQKSWNKICEDRKVEEPENYPPVTHSHTAYYMRERKQEKKTSTRPQRKCAAVDYASLLGHESGTDEPEKKKPVRKPKVTKEPSKDRIAAQQMIETSEKPKHRPPKPDISKGRRFFRKDPSKTKPVHRRPVSTVTEKDDPPKNPDVKPGTSNVTDLESSPPKGQFKTKEHGLKKHKEVRYFRCPKCGIHKTTVMKLNDHYKRRHPLLKCDKCTMSFCTPSGLSRHMYVHSTPRYPCLDCHKIFHFSSELKTHRVVHLKIKAHFCNRGNCGKSFMNNPDLLKHVREHDAKPVSCSECDYTTKNKRLLKSHALSHTDEKPYSCFF